MKMAAKAKSVSKPDDKNDFQQNNLSHPAKYIIANVNLSKCRNGIIINSLPILINLDRAADSIPKGSFRHFDENSRRRGAI
jgi:hypothetical protein